ncbi:hypothetical protein RAG99_27535, partial [Klebsiella pneumoniae]
KRAYCLKIQPATGSFARNLIYSTKPEQALNRSRICSSDPLCSEHDPEKDRSLHGAACHACSLVAETSCEKGNRYLDRALLVPTLEHTEAAFFKDLLNG